MCTAINKGKWNMNEYVENNQVVGPDGQEVYIENG
jgi:hypothetical protein